MTAADHPERTKIRIMSSANMPTPQVNPFLLSAAEEKKVVKSQEAFRDGLRVPRRPGWTRETTREELDRQERESFLDWRRGLAHLAEDSSLLLTPFERNIQLWRQLWRVVERSHLIVQIVDARNILGFRCVDLDAYVNEVGSSESGDATTVPGKGKRKSLLLINKADLLTYEQRCAWADYFEKEGITYTFFSAANAAALQEQAERQRRREAGLDSDYETDEESDEEEDEEEEDEEEEDEEEEEEEKEEEEKEDDEDDDEDWEDDETKDISKELKKTSFAEKPTAATETQPEEVEDKRTRVLTVTELEDLFFATAPPLSDFATERDPNPSKLMVGLVGYPNVGKSSTINALIGSKKVSVSATPGKTKHFQTLVLSDQVTLCDCPGLVFPQFANTQADMICDGVLPIDQMREYSAPVDLLCRRIPREILELTYGIRIDVKDVEDGGTGKVGWEELLSAYAIARGMTRASFGMPDTSRAARYVLKDYVNAKLLFAHPPPGMEVDEFMSTSRERTLEALEEQYANGRKRAPETHVSKNADTYVAPAGSKAAVPAELAEGEEEDLTVAPREKQLTSAQIKRSAASAPARSGKVRAQAFDGAFFTESGPAPRPVVKGRSQGAAAEYEGGTGVGFSRQTIYPHQRRLGPDGMPIVETGVKVRNNGKKHFKIREGKQRSGAGYD